jgi:DNA invertase Pin-like site-specific DNA recombinase
MGKIKAGDCLIVEAIDRLTRLPLDDADQLLRRILRAGVSIVTIRPYQELTPADLNDLGKRMMMLAMCEVSHRSSADKSKWATGSWKKKRAEAAQKKITKLCPSWLELSEDRTQFIPIPAAEKTVRLIYKWYLDGQGVWVIARRLNREGNHGADYIGRNSFYPPCNNGTRWQNYIRLTGGNRQAVTTRRRG